MPKLLEEKLEKEYGNNKGAIYGTMNKIGAMKGNKETKKGKAIEKKMEMAKHVKHHDSFEDTDKKIGEQILKGKIAAAKHHLT